MDRPAEQNGKRAHMRRLHAVLVAAALAVAAYVAVVFVAGDVVFWDTSVPPGRESRAALAIRDDVPPFQKWGSRMFTLAYLHRYYGASWYFTQAEKGDLEEEFVACLENALERYSEVDLFLLAHTNRYVKWVERIPEERRRGLRFVYNTGCHNQAQHTQWLGVGAKTYVGHPGVTWSPMFYFFFLRRWTRGQSVDAAADISNRLMERTLKEWQFVTLGRYDAAALMYESKASRFGDGRLRLEDRQP